MSEQEALIRRRELLNENISKLAYEYGKLITVWPSCTRQLDQMDSSMLCMRLRRMPH
jgi:hypothetical protein